MADSQNPVLRLLSTYARPHLPHFIVATLSMLTARLLWFFPPIVIGVAFDAIFIGNDPYKLPLIPADIIPSGQTEQFYFSAVIITAAYILGVLIYVTGSWVRAIAAYRVQHHLRTTAYEQTQSLGYSFFENREKGDVISILNNDINQIESSFNGTLQLAGNAIFIIIVVSVYMLLLNWQLALLAFITPLIIAGFNYGYSRYIEPKYQRIRNNVGDISTQIENNISGIGVIKAYTREDYEQRRIADLSKEYRDVSWKVSRARIALGQVTGQLSNLGYVLVFFVGGLWVINGPPLIFSGDLAASALLSFLIYNEQFTWPLTQITTIIDRYQQIKASSNRVFELLDEEPAIDDTDGTKNFDITEPAIDFKEVTYQYETADKPAIEDITFHADHGDTIGIVGPTGSGKSTILKLLFRFYDPTTGSITVNDTDIRDFSKHDYRSAIGYVSQDPYLFAGTVAENIGYGAPDASMDDIVEAAKQAKAHDFIEELDDGYDTDVGEEGSRLSGGQRQRIALARAVVGDPEIMILDEATSDVDNRTKVLIQQSLREVTENRTTFVVAHNISTVRFANHILTIEEGTLKEEGSHEDLVQQGGLYADLWRLQTGDFENLSNEDKLQTVFSQD